MDTMSHKLMTEQKIRELYGENRPAHVVPVLGRNIHAYRNALEQLQQVPISRNRACPCGSGRKYKRCCMSNSAPSTGQQD